MPPRPSATNPLAPRPPHFAPRAKRVIFLFMKGGPSHVDTFDYKPYSSATTASPCRSPSRGSSSPRPACCWARPGSSGNTVKAGSRSASFSPNVAGCVDDLCIINSLHGTNPAHGGALLKLHTGSDNFVRPSMGSWITYGLGTENQNLPGFITICPTLAHGGVLNWSSAFLPAVYQGTPLGNAAIPAKEARVRFIKNPRFSSEVQRTQLDMLAELNRDHLEQTGPDQAPGRPARVVRAGLPHADRDAGGRGPLGRVAGDAQGVRPRRPGHRQLRPPVPPGPPVRRARRAVRPGHA